MEVSEPVFPDAPMIHRLRLGDQRRVLMPIQEVRLAYDPVDPELRQRLDAIRANHPFPEEVDDG